MIPTVGRSILRQCLRSIEEGSELPGQLIVVDQSSNPEIRDWLAGLEQLGVTVQHVPSSQTGRASGLNRGIERVQTQFLAITDDDCLVEINWLQAMLAHLAINRDAIVTGRVEAAGDEVVPLVLTSMAPFTQHRPRLKFDTLVGANMGAAKSVFERVGFFDEDPVLRCSEDGEFAYRALRTGVSIVYAPDVAVWHFGWRSAPDRERQYREYARSSGGFYGKYLRRGDWFVGLRALVVYVRELRRFLRACLRRNTEDRRMSWACLRWLVPGIIAGFRASQAR